MRLSYSPHSIQQRFHASKARFRTFLAGVRTGKSVAGGAEIICAAVDKRGHYWCCAPTYQTARIAQIEVEKNLGELPGLLSHHNKSEKQYVLSNGSIIEMRSTENENQLRGPGLLGIWIDEAAFVRDEAARILRTRVSDTGGRIWATTTPAGRNWLHQWYERGLSDDWPDYDSFHAQSRDNPYFPPAEWETAQRELPVDWFRREYRAEYVDGQGLVFGNVDLAFRKGKPSGSITIGIDWASRHDYTVALGLASNGVEVCFERLNMVDYVELEKLAIHLAEKFNARIVHDGTGVGAAMQDRLRAALGPSRVEPVVFTASRKQSMVRALAGSIARGELCLQDHSILRSELEAFGYEADLGKNFIFGAPEGSHDDTVSALMLANHGRSQTFLPVSLKNENETSPVDTDLVRRRRLRRSTSPGCRRFRKHR